jgi:nitrite reductase/ring-hydroxylating ferredoxin subunit/uncharacterized membrane protein
MTTTSSRTPVAYEAFDRLAALEQLDGPAKTIGKAVRDAVPRGPIKDTLSGTWLGHALHPVLTDLPIGTWTSAVLLDWLGGREGRTAADRLVGLGIVASGPAALTGLTEWADSEPASDAVRRIGILHAAGNVTALALFSLSLAARRRGARPAGKPLAPAGAGVLAGGGYLGGHLSFAEGVGVNQTTFEEPDAGWTTVLREADLPEGEARYAEVDGVGVMVARWQGEVYALSNRCAHRGGPLDEGELADGCVTCPLHGSTYRLSDGGVERGPSPYPQPVWKARVRGGVVEVSAPGQA